MFNLINWDSLGDLALDIVTIAVLCLVLFIWAVWVRRRDAEQQAHAAEGDAPLAAETPSYTPRNDPPL